MRVLSDKTRELVRELYRPAGLVERLRGDRGRMAVSLAAIAEAGEPAAISDLLPFALSGKEEVAREAARAIHTLMERLCPSDLPTFDERVRNDTVLCRFVLPRRYWIRPRHVVRARRWKDYAVSVLGACSSYSDGFVREEAVRNLAEYWTGDELPFLLLRVNDWVPQVRRAALSVLGSRIGGDYARHFVCNLPLVLRLQQCGRADHAPLVADIEDLLRAKESREAMWEGLQSNDRDIRRACCRIALQRSLIDQAVVEFGVRSKDNLVRLWSARKISALSSDEDAWALVGRILTDSFSCVRQQALCLLVERFPDRAPAELRRALLDAHPSVRDEARFQISQIESMDFAAFYRDTLAGGTDTYAALCGISEVGDTSDDEWVLPFVEHVTPKVRRASIRALGKLNPHAHIELFVKALGDVSPGITREAGKALAACRGRLGNVQEKIWDRFEKATGRKGKMNSLFVFSHLPKWDSIYYLMKAYSVGDETVRQRVRAYARRWWLRFNLSFLEPTSEQAERISSLLDEAGEDLDKELREALEFGLKGVV